jgi:hypothetical protein
MLNPLLNRFVHEKHERHKNLHKQKKLGTGFSGIGFILFRLRLGHIRRHFRTTAIRLRADRQGMNKSNLPVFNTKKMSVRVSVFTVKK